MAHHKHKSRSSHSIGKIIFNLAILIPTLYNTIGNMLKLMGYETHLAGKSVINIIILSIVSGMLLGCIWLGLLAMLGVFYITHGFSYQFTLLMLVLLNVIIFSILILSIKGLEKNLLFRATRQQIRQVFTRTDLKE